MNRAMLLLVAAALALGAGRAAAQQCTTSNTVFQTAQMPAQSGAFTVEWDATPNASAMDGNVAFGPAASSSWTGYAVLVRFAPSNLIEARDGDTYRQVVAGVAYSPGVSYHFWVDVNVVARTFSARVKRATDGAEAVVATNYRFRTGHEAYAPINYWALRTEASTKTHTVCNLAVTYGGTTTPPQPPPPAAIVAQFVYPVENQEYSGRTASFQTTAVMSDNTPVQCGTLAWESADPTIAAVDPSRSTASVGFFTAVNAGVTQVRARCGTIVGTATLTVLAVPAPSGWIHFSSLEMSQIIAGLAVGQYRVEWWDHTTGLLKRRLWVDVMP